MQSITSILGDIPEIFLLKSDEKDLSRHSFTKQEKSFLINFTSIFKIEGKALCTIYRISYPTFKSWKRNFNGALFNPVDLLRDKSEVESCRTVNAQPPPMEPPPIKRRKLLGDMIPRTRSRITRSVKEAVLSYSSTLPAINGFSKEDQEIVLNGCWNELGHSGDNEHLEILIKLESSLKF